jgi:hypothetical protein
MGTKPKGAILFLDRDQLRQRIAERAERLSRPRDLLLDEARSCRERGGPELERSFPVATGDDSDAKKANIRAHGLTMAKYYARETADDIEALIPLFDRIPDSHERWEAMTRVRKLMQDVRGEAEYGMPSPADAMLKAVEMEHIRSKKTPAADQRQRRERMRSFVADMKRENPSATPARITTLLRKQNTFKALFVKEDAKFKASRRTLEDDVGFLLRTETE